MSECAQLSVTTVLLFFMEKFLIKGKEKIMIDDKFTFLKESVV